MNLSLIIKIKGWVTILAGVIFALVPAQFVQFTGATLGDAGIVMTRLFGFLLLAAGWLLVVTPYDTTAGSKSIAFAVTDCLAVLLLLWSISKGVFGIWGYELVFLYAISACLFTYVSLTRKSNG